MKKLLLSFLSLLSMGIAFGATQPASDSTPQILSNKDVSSATNTFGNLNITGNHVITGASSASNSWIWQNGATISGTATGVPTPNLMYIGADTVDTTTSGSSNLIAFQVIDAPTTGFTGGREAFNCYLEVVGSPGAGGAGSGLVGCQSQLRINSNLGGATGAYANYVGSVFSGDDNVFAQSGATFLKGMTGREIDVSLPTGTSAADLFGLSIVQGSTHAVCGTYDCAGIEFSDQDGVSTGLWNRGISFGGYAHLWPFSATSTLIGAQVRQVPSVGTSIALYGVDWRNVTFQSGGAAFISTGFSVDPNGNLNALSLSVGGIALPPQASPGVTTNTAFGTSAMTGVVTGARDTGLGRATLTALTSGSDNTAVGNAAGTAQSTGSQLTAVGSQAATIFTGSDLDAFGYNAAEFVSSGGFNAAFGAFALTGITGAPTTGADNAAFGPGALNACQGACNSNTGIGFQAGDKVTTGSANTILGFNVASTTLTTGTNNVLIGTNSSIDAATSSTTNTIRVGAGSTAVWSATGTGTPSTSVTTIAGLETVTGALTATGGVTVGTATLIASNVGLTNNAASSAGTLTNAPAIGNPTKWIPINDNGTTRNIPAW